MQEEQPRQKNSAWEKLRDGAKKENETQMFIEELKKEYSLPVISKNNSKEYFENGSKRFKDVDYIPAVMNHKKERASEDGSGEEVDEEYCEDDEVQSDGGEKELRSQSLARKGKEKQSLLFQKQKGRKQLSQTQPL